MMTKLRSLLFQLFFTVWTLGLGVTFPLALLSERYLWWVAHVWTRGTFWALKAIIGINYEFEGLEHVPQEGGYVMVCKHQSAWETLVCMMIHPRPAYVLKRELLSLPFFGWFVRKMDMIAIDRSKGQQALEQLATQAERIVGNGRMVMLFPEGTRRKPGVEPRYKKRGLVTLYQQLDVPVIPVALNSGLFWGRNALWKDAGTITMRFLPPLPQGLSEQECLDQAIAVIEKNSNELNQKALQADEKLQKKWPSLSS